MAQRQPIKPVLEFKGRMMTLTVLRLLDPSVEVLARELDLRVGEVLPLLLRRGQRELDLRLTVADLPEATAPRVQVFHPAGAGGRIDHQALGLARHVALEAAQPVAPLRRAIRRPDGRGLRRPQAQPVQARALRVVVHQRGRNVGGREATGQIGGDRRLSRAALRVDHGDLAQAPEVAAHGQRLGPALWRHVSQRVSQYRRMKRHSVGHRSETTHLSF
jgi:hypothetical protein